MDLATAGVLLTIAGIITGALWKVGTIGRTLGAVVTKLTIQVEHLAKTVEKVDARVDKIEADQLAELRERAARA